ncbi:MAG: succinyl-diaminopimelate desuccinylase [Rubellimicrobium sp.]|nr:succinyl-diaminopimelate desuccinylase [Rubellimicrobium sp.]
MPIDPVALTADLVRCPSVTPAEGGALVLLDSVLTDAGFTCTRVDRGGVANLFARWGAKGAPRSFGFNGHTDVVPPGDPALWRTDPFGGTIRDGRLYGRGAADMKSGVAAFVAAAVAHVQGRAPGDGAILLAITGDEEGEAEHGTRALLDWMAREGEAMSVCLVGEPTCPDTLGQMMKIGRRGSLNGWFTIRGRQGHSAYPERALNPLPAMARLVDRLSSAPLDQGSAHFDASTLAFVTVDTGNPATNVIPSEVRATVNVRFNDLHSGASITARLRAEADRIAQEFGVEADLRVKVSGESFITPPGDFSALVAQAVRDETGIDPVLSTSGGTSDARFIRAHCPVVEFGLSGQTMHQIDEYAKVDEIAALARIYRRILDAWFA